MCYFINLGIPYYATHMDIVCPTESGFVPDIGTFIKTIELTTGKLPDKFFGKPEKICIKNYLGKDNMDIKDSVVIGDRLYTDIRLAQNMGMLSILVLSGETKEDYELSNIRADIVVNSVKDLIDFV